MSSWPVRVIGRCGKGKADRSHENSQTALRSNRRLQLTAFGARDRGYFEGTLCHAPRRQLKRSTFGGNPSTLVRFHLLGGVIMKATNIGQSFGGT
jgi:hypothetical protein